MPKNAQKVERKTQSQISCHYTWLLHGKKLATSMTLPEIFSNPKQAREMANHSSKKKTEDKKERGKKKFKSGKA